MNYTIYKENGEILRVCSTSNIDLQLNDGESYIEGYFRDDEFYIANGVAVSFDKKPGDDYKFDFDTKQWVCLYSEEEKIENEKKYVKTKRKKLLSESDWTQLPDVPLATKTTWASYRQQLRDITTQEGYPFAIIWPEKPE